MVHAHGFVGYSRWRELEGEQKEQKGTLKCTLKCTLKYIGTLKCTPT